MRDEIQPRLNQLKPSQHAKRSQPPPPPKPTRWTERTVEKQSAQALQEAAPQDPKGTQNTPQQVADRERQYMELQYIFAQANQRTLADSRPADSKQTQKPANLLAASQQSTEKAATTVPSNSSTDAAAEAPAHQESHRPLRSVHNHNSARDQVHHRYQPRANQRRIPRVPVRYPPTLTPQHTTELKSSSSLKRSNPLLTTRHRQKNRRLLTHQMNRQTRKPLILLLLVALRMTLPTSYKELSLPQERSGKLPRL